MQDVDTLVETPDGKAFKEYTVTYEPDEWDAKFSQHWKSVKERVEAHRAGLSQDTRCHREDPKDLEGVSRS